MQTFPSQVVEMLRAEYPVASKIGIYMNEVIVYLEGAYSPSKLKEVKENITHLISDHFPKREENIAFILRFNEMQDEPFKVFKPDN
jgi:hypothetical protein